MSNQYETVFIMTPVLSEKQMKETAKKYTDFLKTNGAKIVKEDNWGLRKLAYPIQKKSTGFYHLVEYTAEPEVIADLELTFRRDEAIMRFLTVKMDKHHVEFAKNYRSKDGKEEKKGKEKKEEVKA
jgi:small subunit ribosomal protein S6